MQTIVVRICIEGNFYSSVLLVYLLFSTHISLRKDGTYVPFALGDGLPPLFSSIVLMVMIVPVFAFLVQVCQRYSGHHLIQLQALTNSRKGTGSGWTPGHEICVYWGSVHNNTLICDTAGQDGYHFTSFSVPQLTPAGTDTIYVNDEYDYSLTTDNRDPDGIVT